MIVVPDEILHGAVASRKGEERSNVQTFVIDCAKEPLDFAVGLRRVRAEQVMPNAKGRTDLLKAGQTVGVERMAHRKGKRIVGQHRFDRIGQRRGNVLEKGRRGQARGVSLNRHNGLATEIIDGGKFEVIAGISERRQILQVDVNQLAGPLFFVATWLGRAGRGSWFWPCSSRTRWTVL